MSAKELLEMYSGLLDIRRPWESLWAEVARYVMPRRSPDLPGSIMPSTEKESRLFDTTAVQANMVLANGCVAWMSPMEGQWFSFVPDPTNTDDSLRGWLNRSTQIVSSSLARSNFYTQIHEFYLDRSAFGIAALYIEPGKKSTFNCQCWTVGTFVIDEDEEGNVDTVVRSFQLTARQAVKKFGIDNVSKVVREAFQAGGRKSMEKQEYLHFIMPREEYDSDMLDVLNMPVASYYVEKNANHICRESGYPEMPVFVSRYLEWGSGAGPLYAWSPAFAALPETRQLGFLQKMMDALAEKKAFPPILAPAELEGEIDPNAAGVTYFSPELAQSPPKEWMMGGDYNIGKDRVRERQEAINRAFHVDLFQMFQQINKQMTAQEVRERSSEKLIQFSPTFARLVTELFNPMLERLFNLALYAGLLGAPDDIPPAAQERGNKYSVEYNSRLAQALRSQPVLALHRIMETVAAIAQHNPEVLDNFNWDKAVRMVANVESLPEGIMVAEDDVRRIREARAAAAEKQQKQQEAAMMSDAAAKIGKIPSESPLAGVIRNMGGQGLDAA